MRGNHMGSLSYVFPAFPWRPGSSRPQLVFYVCQTSSRVTTSTVQTVYRKESRPVAKRPADEREPYGFPLILISSVSLAAGFIPAATCFLRLQTSPRVTTSTVQTVYRK